MDAAALAAGEVHGPASFSGLTTQIADYRQTSIALTFGSLAREAYRVHFLQVLPRQYERAVAQAIGYVFHDLYLTVRPPGWVYHLTQQFMPRIVHGILLRPQESAHLG